MQYSGIVLKKQEPFAFHFPCKTDVGQAVRYSGIILKRREPFAFRFPKIKPETGLNIFAQLRPSEPQHSRILRDLLDPRGKHGCGDTFLRLFFEKVLGKTEFSIADGDRWTVSAEAERFDVRIQNQNSTKIIIIENKSNGADDQPNQLYRYWYFGIHQRQYRFQKVDKETYAKILYASPDYGKEPSPQTKMRPAKWDSELPPSVPEGTVKVVRFRREIADWLEACREQISAQSDISQPDMSFYLKQYVDYWRL
jgi:hypothetical protein